MRLQRERVYYDFLPMNEVMPTSTAPSRSEYPIERGELVRFRGDMSGERGAQIMALIGSDAPYRVILVDDRGKEGLLYRVGPASMEGSVVDTFNPKRLLEEEYFEKYKHTCFVRAEEFERVPN